MIGLFVVGAFILYKFKRQGRLAAQRQGVCVRAHSGLRERRRSDPSLVLSAPQVPGTFFPILSSEGAHRPSFYR